MTLWPLLSSRNDSKVGMSRVCPFVSRQYQISLCVSQGEGNSPRRGNFINIADYNKHCDVGRTCGLGSLLRIISYLLTYAHRSRWSIGHQRASAIDRLVGLVVRRLPRERKIPGSNPACVGFFRGRVIPVTEKLALQWLPCQAPGVIGSALGLVSPVSVYCDWVR